MEIQLDAGRNVEESMEGRVLRPKTRKEPVASDSLRGGFLMLAEAGRPAQEAAEASPQADESSHAMQQKGGEM
eukprot:3022979-Lingulodinium_polyedra.AAC.1